MVKSVCIKDIKNNINSINVIDIRENSLYNRGHLSNSINIPYNELILNYKKYLNEYKTYYIYCTSGHTSYKACGYLNKLGYNTINISGGYEEISRFI